MDPTPILFRIIGVFYLFSGIIGLHVMATDSLLDKMLAGITLKPTHRREAVRRRLLLAGSATVGLSGAALMVVSIWAAPIMLLATALQLIWLVWARTNYIPEDAAEARGRRQTTNAAIIFAVMTAAVTWLGFAGRLLPWTDAWALFIPLVAVGLAIFAGRHLLWKPATLSDWQPLDEVEDRPLPPAPKRIRLEPGWGGHDVLDADTGLPFAYFDYLPHDLGNRVHYWTQAFRAGEDAEAREFWAEFESPADEAAHRAEGEALVVELRAYFGEVTGPIYPSEIHYIGP